MLTQPIEELERSLEPDASRRLSNMLLDVVKGKTTDIRTPFMKGLSDKQILDKFMEDVFDPQKRLLNSTLMSIENDQKSKFGSRSFQEPWERRKPEILTGFKIPDKQYPYDPSEVISGLGSLRPASLLTSFNTMKRTTNSGLPALVKKSIILDSKDYTLDLDYDFPCVMFTRTQESKKTRTVWGYPIGKLAVEGKYFLPLFEQLRKEKFFSAYGGPDNVDAAVSALLYQKNKEEMIYSEDFSKFDMTVPESLIKSAFDVVRSYYRTQFEDHIFSICDEFLTIGLATPDGVWSGTHGIPSGSWFTSVIGSLVHLLVSYAVLEKVDPAKNQVMGDDGIILVPKSISKKDIADVYSNFNLSLNQEKTFESDKEVIYLQRYYSDDYKYNGIHRGIYPVFRALNRLIHMERFTEIEQISGADFFSIRAIAILENCRWHPMHAKFVKWVCQNDKFDLEYSHKGLAEYIRKFQSKTVTTVQNQYSDNVAGINAFETVRVLRH
jgi:hypothetical protein